MEVVKVFHQESTHLTLRRNTRVRGYRRSASSRQCSRSSKENLMGLSRTGTTASSAPVSSRDTRLLATPLLAAATTPVISHVADISACHRHGWQQGVFAALQYRAGAHHRHFSRSSAPPSSFPCPRRHQKRLSFMFVVGWAVALWLVVVALVVANGGLARQPLRTGLVKNSRPSSLFRTQ